MINQKIISLVENLLKEGYEGVVEIVDTYPSGIADYLKDHLSVKLDGFCKENLYISANHENLVEFYGRYYYEGMFTEPTVENVVKMAWDKYKYYSSYGDNYSRPAEFEKLFIKYGYLKEQTQVILVEKE